MRTTWTRFLLISALLTVPCLSQAQGSAPIIAVFNVEAKGVLLAADVVDNLSDYVASRLAESGKYQVVPRAQLKSRLVEAKTESYKECYDETCQIELGRELAAQKTLATRIAKVGSQCTISLNVFDLGRATSETAATVSGLCTEDGIMVSLGTATEKLTGTAAPSSQPAPARTPVPLGGGKVESGVIIDKGQSIVNQMTDQTGFLTIKSEPTGANITLNGKEMGKAPLQIEQMVGRYVLVAEMGKLYHSARQEIDLDQTGKRVTLTLPPAFGRLEVTSDPLGAEVSLDGERVGPTPWSADRKPSASYVVRVEKTNYLKHESSVVVEDGKTAVVKAVLQQNFGALIVESDPLGAAITLNDEATGQTTPFTFPTLQPGIAVVKLVLEGYGDAVQRATVRNRETVKMSVKMEAKMGLLVVTSAYEDGTPCDGEVSVDGKAVGPTPWKREVIATRHEVGVKCEKGESKANVVVTHNSRAEVALKVATGARIDWIKIPGGTFEMGSGKGDEDPKHRVTVKGFQMAKTETTVAQYKACVSAGACTTPNTGSTCNWGTSGREDHPVNCIDWSQAGTFCTWAGGRLPSEAEWEYAARSGGKAQEYPWGNTTATCDLAVFSSGGSGCGQNRTWPICSKPSGNTTQGLCDMAGNVWEWVEDWYHSSYTGAPTDGRAWVSPTGGTRVLRGGSFVNVASNLRSSFRNYVTPDSRRANDGGRCLRPIP
jgi:formylglycine-generating enzyme required for sulfatase activity